MTLAVPGLQDPGRAQGGRDQGGGKHFQLLIIVADMGWYCPDPGPTLRIQTGYASGSNPPYFEYSQSIYTKIEWLQI